MRKTLLTLAGALLLGSCNDTQYNVDQVILPAPLTAAKAEASDLAMFRKVYVNGSQAMFFVGDGSSMTVAFIDASGLVDNGRLLSREATRQHGDDASATASNELKRTLSSLSLPDRGFQILPAQGGAVIQSTYGKLSFIGYATSDGNTMRIGASADANLIASLATAAGLTGAFRAMPGLGDPTSADPPQRILLFTSSPEGLAKLICDNAAAIFRKVSGMTAEWTAIDLPAPISLSDTAAIEAIRARLGGGTTMGDDMMSNDLMMSNDTDMVTNAM